MVKSFTISIIFLSFILAPVCGDAWLFSRERDLTQEEVYRLSVSYRSMWLEKLNVVIHNGNDDVTVRSVVISVAGNHHEIDVEVEPLSSQSASFIFTASNPRILRIISARGR